MKDLGRSVTVYTKKIVRKLLFWEGNTAIAGALAAFGFKKKAAFYDPDKRPEGIKTVVYEFAVTP